MTTPEDFKTRLKIAKKKIRSKNPSKNEETGSSSMGAAFKMSTELVSAVLVGTIIGFILDKTFGTKPWLMITFFFLGSAAGIWNVIKTAKNMQKDK